VTASPALRPEVATSVEECLDVRFSVVFAPVGGGGWAEDPVARLQRTLKLALRAAGHR